MKIKDIRSENKALKEELKAAGKERAFFEGITDIFTTTSSLSKSLTMMMNRAKAVTGASAWSLQLADDLFLKTLPIRISGNIQELRIKKYTGISGWVLEKGIPLIVHEVSKDSRFNSNTDRFKKLKINSLLCVPVLVKNKCIGILRLINKKSGNGFSDKDLRSLSFIASFIGMSLERSFLYKKIEEISITDDLTDLYNFRYLNQTVDFEIERALRYGSFFTLIFMDIDNLKEINDKFGHLSGTKVLIETARLLEDNLRKIDIITRYGGDEFVMVLPQTLRPAGLLVAERLRKVIEKHVFLKIENHPVHLTASFGVASFPDNARNKEELLKIADIAMYRGKFSTKNTVVSAK